MSIFTLEGFREDDRRHDPTTYLCKPVVTGELDTVANIVREFCLVTQFEVEMDGEPDPHVRRRILNAFYKTRQKDTRHRHYWRCVVDVPALECSADEGVYTVLQVYSAPGVCPSLSVGEQRP